MRKLRLYAVAAVCLAVWNPAVPAGRRGEAAAQLITAEIPVRDIPYFFNPLQPPRQDQFTLALWNFDGDEGAGQLLGGARITANGRFGRGARLGGGGDALRPHAGYVEHFVRHSSSHLMFDFWCRLDAYPDGTASLIETSGRLAFRLDVLDDGTLRLGGPQFETAVSAHPVPEGRWFHVAIRPENWIQPNRVWPGGSSLTALVDGEIAVCADNRRRYIRGGVSPAPVSLGNSLKRDAGVKGVIDAFRISSGAAGFYPVAEQEFAVPETPGQLKRGESYFRNPAAEVFRADFDRRVTVGDVLAPGKPDPLDPMPAHAPRGFEIGGSVEEIVGFDEKEDFIEDFIVELEMSDEERKLSRPVIAVPGVRGDGLRVRGGEGRLELSGDLGALPRGTLEFWFRPEDWSNMARQPPMDYAAGRRAFAYRNRNLHVLTLWGEPEGGGDAKPLVSFNINRAMGDSPVRPEFRRHFDLPQLPITPNRWRHVLVTWDDRFPFLRGRWIDGQSSGMIRLASDGVLSTHRPTALTLGNRMATHFDEIRLYDYAFEGAEHANARAAFTGGSKTPLAEDETVYAMRSIGDVAIEAGDDLIQRITGSWRDGWVSGRVTEGPARVFFGFRPSVGRMIVALAPDEPETVDYAELTFHLPHEDRTIDARIPDFSPGKGGVLLVVGDLPEEKQYPVTAALYNSDGTQTGSVTSAFYREKFECVGHDLGLPDEPPPPFTHVEVEGSVVRVVGREHDIGPDGNYRQLTVQGEPILASPVRLAVLSNGREVELEGAGVEFGQVTPVKTSWRAGAAGAGLKVKTGADFDYDGLARYELQIAPEGPEATVDGLTLEIPLKEEYAYLFHTGGPGTLRPGSRAPATAGMLPFGEGLIWNSRDNARIDRYVGRAGYFANQMWIGGIPQGLVWYADNNKGWVPSDTEPGMTITRENGVATLRLHFISEPYTLTEPRTIRYSLMATPPKPLPEDYRLWNRGDTREIGPIGGPLRSCDAFRPWTLPPRARGSVRGGFPYWPPQYEGEDDWDHTRMAVELQYGGRPHPARSLMMYHAFSLGQAMHPKMMPYYGWSWGTNRYPPDRIDHQIWYFNRMLEAGFHGIYIDNVFDWGDWNRQVEETREGTAYWLERPGDDPVTVPGCNHGAYRDYLKRMYALFHMHGKPPLITTHMSTTLGWPYHAHATVAFGGENAARWSIRRSFIDCYPLDYMMAMHVSERTGLVHIMMVQGAGGDDRPEEQGWAVGRSAQAVFKLLDMAVGRIRGDRYYGTHIEVYPFWRNDHMIELVPHIDGEVEERDLPLPAWWKNEDFRRSIGEEPLRATIYMDREKQRCLLIVANFLRRPVGAGAAVDFGNLGIPAELHDSVRAVDLEDAPPAEKVFLPTLHLDELLGPWERVEMIDIKTALREIDLHEMDDFTRVLQEDIERGMTREESLRQMQGLQEEYLEVELEDGRLSFNVPPHNYRAIELRWGEDIE